ncbi:hypothetical protein RM549_14540 [Salegentibacter sp. F188]|uniref:Uncharacterized protein n=1 Tax=Autumnicola patrickiae TaxID=3075591 RepID=A0ABU3E4U7_9FLAO|nr:hypothetical protein [Salegentibacter sp. F188]MDT0691010.1 hypothetical protein [Salegentibacter sp. F188]
MASYLNKNEIKTSLRVLIKQYLQECRNSSKLSQDFIKLLEHNFLAKYVIYNKSERNIEIGIEDRNENSETAYPKIKVYKYKLDDAEEKIISSCGVQDSDFEFYGRLLNRNDFERNSEVVLMH